MKENEAKLHAELDRQIITLLRGMSKEKRAESLKYIREKYKNAGR